MKLSVYPKYKLSGTQWLGKIPEHWKNIPGKKCFTERKISNIGLVEDTVLSLSYGKIIVKPPEKLYGLVPSSFETYQIIEPHDIVIRPTDLQNDWNSLRFSIATVRGIITSAYMCFRTTEHLTPYYGYLLLHAYDLKKIFYSLGSGLRQNLGWHDFKYLPCILPPLSEQVAIVHYLGYMDRRIRRYIGAKRKLIGLLEEQKRLIIHRAVTRGLNPDVPLKDSGVEWLGEVPEHWQSGAIKHYYSIQLGKMLQSRVNTSADVEVPYLKAQHVQWFSVRNINAPKMWASLHDIEKFGIRPGDLLVCEGGEGGRSGLIKEIASGYIIQKALHRVRPSANCRNDYLQYLMNSAASTGWFDAINNKATIAHFTGEKFGALIISLPPLSEQTAIVEYLDTAIANLDAAIDRAGREIELLNEYRTRLIADVVTGKVDVREAAASLPDEFEELDPVNGEDELLGDGEVLEDEQDGAIEEAEA